MKKTNKYYIDEEGNMIGYPRYRQDKTEIEAKPFCGKLKLIRLGYLNSGIYLELQDEAGKIYSMNDIMLAKYIKNNDVFIDGSWDFYQQGTAFSIGEQKI